MTEVNEDKMRKELIEIYEAFLKNPNDKDVHSKAINYDRAYGGLNAYKDTLKKPPIPEDLDKALSGLGDIFQYGDGTLDDEKNILFAKEILKDLKKEQ